jgi:sterol 3beta-glucosyltransferase
MASPTAVPPALSSRARHPASHLHMSVTATPPLAASTPNLHTGELANSRRVSNRLHKKRKDGPHTPTLEMPDRLKETPEEEGQEEDVRASKPGVGGGMNLNLNQSIFGLIAAAGSCVDFQDRFEGQSSDEEDAEDASTEQQQHQHQQSRSAGKLALAKQRRKGEEQQGSPAVAQRQRSTAPEESAKSDKKHRRKFSHGLMRSVPGLARLSSKSKRKSMKEKVMSESQILERDEDADARAGSGSGSHVSAARAGEARGETGSSQALSRMLEARAAATSRPSFTMDRSPSGTPSHEVVTPVTGDSADLATKLQEIFEFNEVETVVGGEMALPCHLLFT